MKRYVKIIFIGLVCLIFIGVGITYTFFNYTRIGQNNKVIAGSLYLTMNEGNDTINLTNIFPESKEEARARNNNVLTFTLKGKNTSTTKDINYEILLNNGNDNPEKERIDTKNLVFDLIEVGANNEETYVLDAVSYDELSDQKIWIDSVSKNTTTEIEKTYKLRVWVSEDTIISDSDPNADYTTNEYKNLYASVKVAVEGDLESKILPLVVTISDLQVINNQSYINNVIENTNSVNSQDTFVLTITSSNNNVDFVYNNDPVVTNINNNIINQSGDWLVNNNNRFTIGFLDNSLNTFEETYTIDNNKKVTFKVFLITINKESDSADLHFVLKKNNVVVQDFIKHVNVVGANRTVPHIEFVNQTATYNGTGVTPSNVTITNSDNTSYSGQVTYKYYNGDTCDGQELMGAPIRPGTYSVKITASGTGNDSATSICGNITINKKNITPTINNCTNRRYSGETDVSCELSATGIVGDDIVMLNGTCNANTPAAGDNKSVICSNLNLLGDNQNNYSLANNSVTANSSVSISKAPLTIIADSKSIEYGEGVPELSYTANGFVGDENIEDLTGSLEYTIKDRNDNIVTINNNTAIGTYFITLSGLSSDNYDITYIGGTLTILGENTITYDCTTNGGDSANQEATVAYGNTVDLTKTCTKNGWTFIGWNTNSNATTAFESYTMGETSTVLYAIYRKEAVTRTLTFNPNGNTSFTYNDNTYTTATTFDMCTIPAVYNNTVQDSSCTANITMASITAHNNTPVIIGWSTGANNRTPSYTSDQDNAIITLTENTTLYAQTSDAPSEVTIVFDVNDNEGSDSTLSCTPPAVYNGATSATCNITSPNITPASNTPVIIGWSNADDRHIADWPVNSERGVYTNATYYAQTKNNPVSFNVTYDNNGATSGNATNTTCTIASTYNGEEQPTTCSFTLATAPIKTGKNFIAWKSLINNGYYNSNETISMSSDDTFTAMWEVLASEVGFDNTHSNINCNDTQCAVDYLENLIKPICKRATVLHTETCTQSSNYCYRDGYYVGGSKNTTTITYGNLGTQGNGIVTGDAFDCDVNGDNIYDPTTERFYYISDRWTPSDSMAGNTFDSNYAILIYSQNFYNGAPSTSGSAYHSTDNWHGPVVASTHLPTTSTWSKVSLVSTSRAIKACNDANCGTISSSTTGGTITPSSFSYEGKAARLITLPELIRGCKSVNGNTSFATTGALAACNFLYEKTKYAASSAPTHGPWFETPNSTGNDLTWWTSVYYGIVSTSATNNVTATTFGVRPVIEIPYSKISY